MGVVPRSRNPTMESLSQFLVGRLAPNPPTSPSKLLHTRQSPSTRKCFPSFMCRVERPIPATSFQQRVWLFSQYLPRTHLISSTPQKLNVQQLLTASRSRIQQAISFNSDYFILFIFSFLKDVYIFIIISGRLSLLFAFYILSIMILYLKQST